MVHTFNLSWESSAMAAWQFAAQQNVPLVVTPFAHVGSSATARNISMDHQRRLLLAANQVQALSTAEKEGLALWGVDGSRIDVVGSGFVPRMAPAQTGAARFGIHGPYALFVGRLSFDKGALHAAEAVLALRRAGIDLSLVLAGYTTPEFERFYDALPHDQHSFLRAVGRVSDEEKQALLGGAEMLLLPSRADALGIVILEAWSYGKPVVAARAGGIPGVIDDGEDGLLVAFGDVRSLAGAAQRLLETPQLAQQLGRRGREKVLVDYAWPAVTDRVLDGYDRARAHFQLASPRTPPPARPATHPHFPAY
jgi:glycosyltransferase involved in cell wall biosynthesis